MIRRRNAGQRRMLRKSFKVLSHGVTPSDRSQEERDHPGGRNNRLSRSE
jgi:hypothetical protein